MLLNNNELYSAMNKIEKLNNEEVKKVIEQIQILKKIKTSQEAKDFCKEYFGISKNITNYSLNGKCFLTIEDLETVYSLNFTCVDEIYSINYKKGDNNV